MAAVDDLKKLLALVPGGATVNQKLADFEAYIRAAAKAGALEAVPEIQEAVKKTVTPYIYVAIGLGALGFLMGLKALRASNARSLRGLSSPRYLL